MYVDSNAWKKIFSGDYFLARDVFALKGTLTVILSGGRLLPDNI